jgi:PrpF protein
MFGNSEVPSGMLLPVIRGALRTVEDGARPNTSKVAIIAETDREDADIEYTFAQVGIADDFIDYRAACGNIYRYRCRATAVRSTCRGEIGKVSGLYVLLGGEVDRACFREADLLKSVVMPG